ncbi:TEA/ATTS domain family-domain-containing protein [Melampsora americana]|nr:TEA/ATTS domain family-domain-containing protein [Melampsora americana]
MNFLSTFPSTMSFEGSYSNPLQSPTAVKSTGQFLPPALKPYGTSTNISDESMVLASGHEFPYTTPFTACRGKPSTKRPRSVIENHVEYPQPEAIRDKRSRVQESKEAMFLSPIPNQGESSFTFMSPESVLGSTSSYNDVITPEISRRSFSERERRYKSSVPALSPLATRNFSVEDTPSVSSTPISTPRKSSSQYESAVKPMLHVPMLSLSVTESLNEALMIIGYLRQKSLSRESTPRDRNTWCQETLLAFDEAIRTIPRLGRAKLLALTPEGKRPFGRNELIADYIYRRTGIERDRKQVSSHIQVIKNSKKAHPSVSELLCPAPDGESMAFDDCTASWYGACITGDLLALHACTPEFPFPSQVLSHLPAMRSDREWQNFLKVAHDMRKSGLSNTRLDHDLMNADVTQDSEIHEIVKELDTSIIRLACDATFKKALDNRQAARKFPPADSVDAANPTKENRPGSAFPKRILSFGCTSNPNSFSSPCEPSSKPIQIPLYGFGLANNGPMTDDLFALRNLPPYHPTQIDQTIEYQQAQPSTSFWSPMTHRTTDFHIMSGWPHSSGSEQVGQSGRGYAGIYNNEEQDLMIDSERSLNTTEPSTVEQKNAAH